MPKLSYDQQITRLESTLALVRLNADTFPPLALAVADDLERFIAKIKELKLLQRTLLAAQMTKTEELASVIDQGTLAARELRACVVLALGTKDARLSTFGIRVRGRPGIHRGDSGRKTGQRWTFRGRAATVEARTGRVRCRPPRLADGSPAEGRRP